MGFVFCLLLRPPIQAQQIRALASGWLLLVLLGQPGMPHWGVGIDATKSRHVAGFGYGALGEYLPRKPNALGWL